jgi:hypothetical protein
VTGGEVVAAALAVGLTVLLAAVIVLLVVLVRTLAELRAALGELSGAVDVAADLRVAVERADDVLSAAETAYLGAAKPVVKAMALTAGTAKAARRLRSR